MNHPESVLYSHLTDVDSLDVLFKEGLDPEVIPSDLGRKIVAWTEEYYFKSGRTLAPTAEAIHAVWGEQMSDAEISLGDGTEGDSIEYAIDTLKSNWVHWKDQTFLKEHGREMAKADGPDRAKIVAAGADALYDIARVVASRRNEVDARAFGGVRWQDYESREVEGAKFDGLTFGLDEVDQYTHGIHPGELCVVAAPPKTGKSFFLLWAALNEWRRGRIAMLYTLENSVEMTMDRLVCMAVRLDYGRFQRGALTEGEKQRGKAFMDELAASETPLFIQAPEQRTPAALIRRSLVEGAQSVLVDQTSHVEIVTGRREQKMWEKTDVIMKEMTDLISNGRERLPLVMAHQINREGVKAARKDGRLYMDHMADGAAVERYCSWAFGLYRSDENVAAGAAQLSTLAVRRAEPKAFELDWKIQEGLIRVRYVLDEEKEDA